MKLSLQDQIALMYTATPNYSELSRQIGISRRTIYRILRTGQEGGYRLNAPALQDPLKQILIRDALDRHAAAVAIVARAHGLPYTSEFPVMMSRMRITDGPQKGILGDRVQATHTHWLSDRLRDAWLNAIQKTKRFANVSAGSLVELRTYNKKTDDRLRGQPRELREKLGRAQLRLSEFDGTQIALIQTPYVVLTGDDMDRATRIEILNQHLKERHKPATGDDKPGTAFASRVLFQLDTRGNRDEKFRSAHPWAKASKPTSKGKAPRSAKARAATTKRAAAPRPGAQGKKKTR